MGEGGVLRVEVTAKSAGVNGFGNFVESQEGQGRAIEGFDIGRIEAEGGGTVEYGGAVVPWRLLGTYCF